MRLRTVRASLSLALLALLLGLSGCARTAKRPAVEMDVTQATLINPLGPAVIPVIGIGSGAVASDLAVNVQYWKTADEALGLLSSGDAEFAVLPITNGANMAASGLDLVLLGVHEWKAFYLVAADGAAFDGWDSLAGKTVYTPEAKGQTVDVLTRYALSRQGLTPDEDVTFVYAPAQEIVALFGEGQIEYAALPEPFVTQALAAGAGRVALDYQDYWSEVSGAEDGIPIAGLFVTREFYEAYPGASQAVATLVSASTDWANENPDEAVQACAEVLPLPAEVLRGAMDRLVFAYVPAAEAKGQVLDFLSAIQDTYPEGVKAIPDDTFFAAE
jgi:NitT/TauT family transport system substrate-binding protein